MFIGLFSDPTTWDQFANLLREDAEIVGRFDLQFIKYTTPYVRFRPDRAIPSVNAVALQLGTFVQTATGEHDGVVFVAHSQGGLIVQKYLADLMNNMARSDLGRVRGVVLFACPNSGSEWATVAKHKLPRFIGRNTQIQALVPLNDAILEWRRPIINRIVNASPDRPDTYPIPIRVYAGTDDGIVPLASAIDHFLNAGALRGDHSGIIRPKDRQDDIYRTLRMDLLDFVARLPRQRPGPDADMASLPAGALGALADVLATVAWDPAAQIRHGLPSPDQRFAVVDLIDKLARRPGGREQFLDLMWAALPEGQPDRVRVFAAINEWWPTLTEPVT